jgi:hypothetical protein
MTDQHAPEPMPKTQLTQPKGIDPKTGKPHKPIEIPVPKRSVWEKVLGRAAGEHHRGDDRTDKQQRT